MDTSFFISSLLIGFSVAAVVGPIAILCIQRTLHKGFWYGLVTGLGAATADAMYGSVVGFGLTIIASLLVSQLGWLHVPGGLFLLYLGIKTMLSKPAERTTSAQMGNFFGAYTSTLLLTLTNPQTILSFAAIFAGLGVGSKNSTLAALLIVCGVFLGSTLWWCLLAGGTYLLRGKITHRWLTWINRLSGCFIAVFGLFALLK